MEEEGGVDRQEDTQNKEEGQTMDIKQNEEAKRTNKFLMENYSMLFNDLCYGF